MDSSMCALANSVKKPRGQPSWLACIHASLYFSSTDQYALSRNVFHDWYFLLVSFMLKVGLRFGFSGLRIRLMCACFGVRPPFLTLQSMHAHTTFSQEL